MIITQTPLRISFLGGGTDFPDYYLREGGIVVSSAINKYIFVTVKERFDDKIRIGYSRTELVDHVDQIEHDLVRECLRQTGVDRRIEISTMADIPSEGSGLGSSSTVTIGLLNALYTYQGVIKDQEALARAACAIEIEILKKPIGVQDQYIAAYGGQRLLRFEPDGSTVVEPLGLSSLQVQQLNRRLMLFFTNVTRSAESVLTEQKQQIDARLPALRELKRLAMAAYERLHDGDLDGFGHILHEGWQQKRQLASGVSNVLIDDIYATARRAGALGGKITGAGGGGFLLLYAPPEHRDQVRSALYGLPELDFQLERDGTKVILNYRRT